MRNFAIALCLILWAGICFGATIDVSGRAGVYTSPAGTTSMMYGVSASYPITPNLSLRAALETTTYTSGGIQTTYSPVSVDLIYSQDIGAILHPYAGAGVSYHTTTVG
ncbi:MAG: hypothetical protein ACPL4K_04335, partial [Candidatus Margulisiibacteriota bacterium]